MQFPQISALCLLFYVNTIKSQKNPIFIIDFTRHLAYNRGRADIGNIPAVLVNRGDKHAEYCAGGTRDSPELR